MRRKWTEEDLIFLKEHYSTSSLKHMTQALKRSKKSIYKQAYKQGLKRKLPDELGLTLYELSEITSIYYMQLRKYIDNGMQYNIFKSGFEKNIILVEPQYFWDYAAKNKDKIDFSKIEPLTLLPEPDWFYEERKKEKKLYSLYSLSEIDKMKYLYLKGMAYRQISQVLNRSFFSVKTAIHRYGISSLSR